MTFLEALKPRRPMRRQSFNNDRDWICLGEEGVYPRRNVWRRIKTGEVTGLSIFDYEATDWEVMP